MLSALADETAHSKVLRRHLQAAGVTRPELFPEGDGHVPIRLRSLRDAGITWRLWRGDNPFVVQRHAGHKRFSTTEKYVADIERLTAECGEAFPAMSALSKGKTDDANVEGSAPLGCERRELNSPKPHCQGESNISEALAFALREAAGAQRWELAAAIVAELSRRGPS